MEEKTSDASTPHQIPRNASSRSDERGDESSLKSLNYVIYLHITS